MNPDRFEIDVVLQETGELRAVVWRKNALESKVVEIREFVPSQMKKVSKEIAEKYPEVSFSSRHSMIVVSPRMKRTSSKLKKLFENVSNSKK